MSGKTLHPVLFLAFAFLLLSAPAPGAVGDLVQTVNLPAAAHCDIGTSVAALPGAMAGFPAIPLLLVVSCYGGNQLFFVDPATDPATLVNSLTTVPAPAGGWGSLAFRADQGDLTGCGNQAGTHPLYRIDPNTGAATFLFNTVAGYDICDGHTWDATDQTFFVSPDVSATVYHFSDIGLPLGSLAAAGGCPNSGVAVGGGVLYEACNGVLTIFRTDKASGAVLGSFASAGSRTEDLECDPISFSGLGIDVMWSKDAYTDQLFAFEIPEKECGFGGKPPEIEVAVDIKPTSCPNPLQCKSSGVVPVAILGSAELDVTTIDPASIRLVDVAPLRAVVADVAAPFLPAIGKAGCLDCTTQGPDGFPDLVLKFSTQELLAAIGAATDGACLLLPLTGNLLEELGGTPISGEDVMRFQCR